MLCQNTFIFGQFIFVNVIFHFLDTYVTRNGHNLNVKVNVEFSLSMGLMLTNHSNLFIHSIIVLCDSCTIIHYALTNNFT